MKKLVVVGLASFFLLFLSNCSSNPDDNSINIFSVNDDIKLGQQVKAEIAANPSEYPLLDELGFAVTGTTKNMTMFKPCILVNC